MIHDDESTRESPSSPPAPEAPRAQPRRRARKLLAATLGLATLSLTGCGGVTSGNLVVPPPDDAGTDAAAPAEDAGQDR